ncbi:MAG: lysophospholipid acyltransferase family protein [Elusimicrobia bacterium]|nr:lysophospholipid acyltransferase family protein [Elusimicrobiota bacterium]
MFKKIIPILGYVYLWVVGKTSRIIWKNLQICRDLERHGKNFIYAFWHSRQFVFVYSHRRQPVTILVSASQDGEYIARTLHLFGMKTVRGSSTRGGFKALKQLMEHTQQGLHPGVTPDGPRGPVRKVKPGVLFLAQKLKLPIIPITNASRTKVTFKSWDEIHLPLPFNRIVIVHGSPIYISARDSLKKKAKELETALNRITKEADKLADAHSL